jgi:hypothetical protein
MDQILALQLMEVSDDHAGSEEMMGSVLSLNCDRPD